MNGNMLKISRNVELNVSHIPDSISDELFDSIVESVIGNRKHTACLDRINPLPLAGKFEVVIDVMLLS